VSQSPQTPRCEACGREPASSFSWFADRDRWYAPRSGAWRFTGDCTSESEQYYVLLRNNGHGFLDSVEKHNNWIEHLRDKRWFDPADFRAALSRFEAAGGDLTPAVPTHSRHGRRL
jgi:hypothetical protein